jgi:hypothetical protein
MKTSKSNTEKKMRDAVFRVTVYESSPKSLNARWIDGAGVIGNRRAIKPDPAEKILVPFMIFAWRIARLMRLGRTAPRRGCGAAVLAR